MTDDQEWTGALRKLNSVVREMRKLTRHRKMMSARSPESLTLPIQRSLLPVLKAIQDFNVKCRLHEELVSNVLVHYQPVDDVITRLSPENIPGLTRSPVDMVTKESRCDSGISVSDQGSPRESAVCKICHRPIRRESHDETADDTGGKSTHVTSPSGNLNNKSSNNVTLSKNDIRTISVRTYNEARDEDNLCTCIQISGIQREEVFDDTISLSSLEVASIMRNVPSPAVFARYQSLKRLGINLPPNNMLERTATDDHTEKCPPVSGKSTCSVQGLTRIDLGTNACPVEGSSKVDQVRSGTGQVNETQIFRPTKTEQGNVCTNSLTHTQDTSGVSTVSDVYKSKSLSNFVEQSVESFLTNLHKGESSQSTDHHSQGGFVPISGYEVTNMSSTRAQLLKPKAESPSKSPSLHSILKTHSLHHMTLPRDEVSLQQERLKDVISCSPGGHKMAGAVVVTGNSRLPPERAMLAGDVIIEVNGNNVMGRSFDEVTKLLHSADADVHVVVARPIGKLTACL